jgi:cytochrome b pre-mRNA-processing protein 3
MPHVFAPIIALARMPTISTPALKSLTPLRNGAWRPAFEFPVNERMPTPMSLLKRLLRPKGDDLSAYRPLWHRVVELSRDPAWYRDAGIADTVPGRFDAITLILCAVLLRMERDEALIEPSVRLTELFVDDMDGQLRQSGVGDMVVGKHMGRLMSALGGRLGAYRAGLATQDLAPLEEAIARNVTLNEGSDPAVAAGMMRKLNEALAGKDGAALLAGDIALEPAK